MAEGGDTAATTVNTQRPLICWKGVLTMLRAVSSYNYALELLLVCTVMQAKQFALCKPQTVW